ncbi:ribonuclease E/G [Pseudoprimorskyibacter insulae]|uniref:Ribonuclease G n=1 Tax=Pseudoprimorskyibacter insulae TaxID=1695997 RepID=A0A2R8AQW6_9RHOB|nr:ribonuclease E/G [Pseudoprimorskyibacter insulae]SPF78229.1 Ribonuclease G [Pseudoprimorskyibacter insulae]
MKGRTIVLGQIGEQEAAALMVDGRLEDLLLDTDLPRPGTIYRAIADRPVKGQGGMFLRTPDGTAFVRQVKGVAPGQVLLVQVTGYAEPGKAIPVTTKVLFKSRYAIVTPEAPGLNVSRSVKDEGERDRILEIAHEVMEGSTFGLILRSACAGADEDDIADDVAAMRQLAEAVTADTAGEAETLVEGDGPHVLAWREWTEAADIVEDPDGFENLGVADALEDLRSPCSVLAGSATVWVEATRALVAVDVNTGGDTSPAAGLKANLAAARDLPRLLRLRGLGGQIVIDFAPLPKKDRRQVEGALRSAFRHDQTETTLVGWTGLGHYELHRKRDRIALSEVLA